MKKRLLSLLLSLCMGLALLPAAAFAAGSSFTIEDGVLTEYNGPGGDVVIPNGVTEIGSWAFLDCTGLTSVSIPGSVTSIGLSAFQNCTGLTAVNIPDGVTGIGIDAFSGCTGLTGVTIPSSVTSIDMEAFSGCTGLTRVTIPDSVTGIGSWAFQNCTGLNNVAIPGSVTGMEPGAFYGCTGLTDVAIPDSITSIGWCIFQGCTGLTSVTIPDSVTYIGPYAFFCCENLKNIYYSGTEAQWEAIEIGEFGDFRDDLKNAAIHCNSTGPTELELPGTQTGTAYASTQNILLDGKQVELEAILLTDNAGNGYTYFKMRDLGEKLNFNVDWSVERGIFIETDRPYCPGA